MVSVVQIKLFECLLNPLGLTALVSHAMYSSRPRPYDQDFLTISFKTTNFKPTILETLMPYILNLVFQRLKFYDSEAAVTR